MYIRNIQHTEKRIKTFLIELSLKMIIGFFKRKLEWNIPSPTVSTRFSVTSFEWIKLRNQSMEINSALKILLRFVLVFVVQCGFVLCMHAILYEYPMLEVIRLMQTNPLTLSLCNQYHKLVHCALDLWVCFHAENYRKWNYFINVSPQPLHWFRRTNVQTILYQNEMNNILHMMLAYYVIRCTLYTTNSKVSISLSLTRVLKSKIE